MEKGFAMGTGLEIWRMLGRVWKDFGGMRVECCFGLLVVDVWLCACSLFDHSAIISFLDDSCST